MCYGFHLLYDYLFFGSLTVIRVLRWLQFCKASVVYAGPDSAGHKNGLWECVPTHDPWALKGRSSHKDLLSWPGNITLFVFFLFSLISVLSFPHHSVLIFFSASAWWVQFVCVLFLPPFYYGCLKWWFLLNQWLVWIDLALFLTSSH